MFWSVDEGRAESVITAKDKETYTHIIYLDIAPEVVAERPQNDKSRVRLELSIEHLKAWQKAEKDALREICLASGIMFSVIKEHKIPGLACETTCLLRSILEVTEEDNMLWAHEHMDHIIKFHGKSVPKIVLIFDGDKTLAPHDTGDLFWEHVPRVDGEKYPLTRLFGSHLGYSFKAFYQAALLYRDVEDLG